jgi:gliding motility-associated-like protein
MKNAPAKFIRCLLLLLFFTISEAYGQAIIRVKVVSVQAMVSAECDGVVIPFIGCVGCGSDFVWEFTAVDNTIGYTNNNPALFGVFDFNYAFNNNVSNPYTLVSPSPNFVPNNGLFFDHEYYCPSDVPALINLAWEGYENDDVGNYNVLGLSDGETGLQNVTMAVPGAPGVLPYSFTAVSTDGGCPQTYKINLQVERLASTSTAVVLADNICNANLFNTNTTYTTAFCLSNSLENNEPRGGDVAATNSSAWFKFVAPNSGAVEITTDETGTEFGTYFQLYHAADGGVCGTGIQPITGTLIKDKFEYLSHHEFSDGIDLFESDPEAQLSFNACDPLSPFSYQKLIAGQTYYVQISGDDANDAGIIKIRINDLGGGPAGDTEDIPCLSSTVTPLTNVISSTASSPVTAVLDFGCAHDGGNDRSETGTQHTNNDPNRYHAYDYNHPAFNNPVMNESVWLNFIAPNKGRMIFEADYQSALYGENNALFGYDKDFAPGIPADYSCANLEFLAEDDGGTNSFLGGDPSAVIQVQCLEPGYKYFGMIDPSDNVTPLNAQSISAWLYDPSVANPTPNPPGNDILCLALADPLYAVPVTPAGTNPNFQAVAGSNEFACREYLAGEPPAAPLSVDRCDQTVWHYFIAPPSGVVEMNIRAYIGMDTLRYNIFELLNGTDCYGGLGPATFTQDGTRFTPIITPLLEGSAGFDGTQESLCCLIPGKIYAIQLDGGAPGDEGQYIIEYIREVESDAGDIFVQLANGTQINVTQPDTAFVCFGDSLYPGIMVNGIGQSTLDIPGCLTLGYVMHSTNPVPNPAANSGFTFIDSVQTATGGFVNNTSGNGTFSNPNFNQVYWISPMADEPANWGDLTCSSSTVENGVPVVFLQPIVPVTNYNNALCEISFSATGGIAAYNGSPFDYLIENASGNAVDAGTISSGVTFVYEVPSAEVFTITLTDGSCPFTFTVDASACNNPCVVSPNIQFVASNLCNGETIFLEGANQTSAGVYTDVFTAANGCDSTVVTTVTLINPVTFEQTQTICQGLTFTVGTSVYNTSGQYTDVFTGANGCDSTVITTLFVESTINSSQSATICNGDTYDFNGQILSETGSYTFTTTAVGGCDSVITFFLNELPANVTNLNVTICSGASYTFEGQTLTQSGQYSDTLTASNGCDSIRVLNLIVSPAINGASSATICSGQSYNFGTQVLSQAGTYTELYQTTAGCDSLATLFLFVDDAPEYFSDTTICLGEVLIFGSQNLTVSGIYDELFPSASGCDSLVHLELTVSDCEGPFIISNILTPNDDGQNDTWKISDYTKIAGCNVSIYNRWGQSVYQTTDYQNDWSGTKDGEPLPDGVYFYSILCGDTEYKGPLNLFRFKK